MCVMDHNTDAFTVLGVVAVNQTPPFPCRYGNDFLIRSGLI